MVAAQFRSRGNRVAVMNAVMMHRQNTAIMNNRRMMVPVAATVQAVVDGIDLRSVTPADLQAFATMLAEAVRAAMRPDQVADQVAEQAPLFGPVGQFIRANEGLIALVALVVAVMAFLQDRDANARTDSPPSVTVQIEPPGRAEIERIVEERLRELEGPAPVPADEATPAG